MADDRLTSARSAWAEFQARVGPKANYSTWHTEGKAAVSAARREAALARNLQDTQT